MFLAATKTYISKDKEAYFKTVKILRLVLRVVETFIILMGLFFIIARISKDDSKNSSYPELEDIFIVVIFMLTLVCYTTITIMLLLRLKSFYPTFYQREKKKVT